MVDSINDIIILIGDTPSYLKIFLKDKVRIVNLPISNKPFGCFWPPNQFENPECKFKDAFTPNIINLNNYFTYLTENTILTKEFCKKNGTI